MEEAAEAAASAAVGEVQLVLADLVAGADRVDGHAQLHAIAAGEGQRGAQRLDPHRALARDRGGRVEAAKSPDRPVSESQREAEAAADPIREDRHREVAIPSLDRIHERYEPRRRIAQVAVAQQDDLRRLALAQDRLGRGPDVPALAVRTAATDDAGAGAHRYLRGAVGGGVVGDPDDRERQRLAQSLDRLSDPVGLVAGGDDHGEVGHGGYSPAP